MTAHSLLRPDTTSPLVKQITKHWGPGPHPGTGTPQTIHAPGGGLVPEVADKLFTDALAPLIEKYGAPKSGFTYVAGVNPAAFKWFNEIYHKLNEDEALFAEFGPQLDKWWETYRAIDGENQRDLYIRLAKGEISVEEATNLGLSEYDQEIRELGDLPPVVYHATTDASSVLESGLKARDELGQSKGLGLGGGTANTISFTSNEDTARGILRGMQERHAVLNDPATHIPRLIEEAKAGTDAKSPWWDARMETKWGSEKAAALSNGGVDALLKGEAIYVASLGQKSVEELRVYWAKDNYYQDKYDLDSIELIKPATDFIGDRAVFRAKYTPKGHAEALGDFMDEYAAYREGAGGHLDPLFISNDDYAFAQKKPSDFAVIKGKTKPGTRGYHLGSLAEWRTWTGEVLESMEVLE